MELDVLNELKIKPVDPWLGKCVPWCHPTGIFRKFAGADVCEQSITVRYGHTREIKAGIVGTTRHCYAVIK